jgi:transposase
MSLKPDPIGEVPEETARVAHAAFPKGNIYMRMRDEIGPIYEDEMFTPVYPKRGQPAETPWRLALTTVMQFVEGLTDRQAAEAVRGRIDWKYALGLELEDTGFDDSVLCEFRARLVEGSIERSLLDVLLERFKEKGLLKARGQQRTDSTHVLAAVQGLHRLELVGEVLRAALNKLALIAPEWLGGIVKADWFDRYAIPFAVSRLPKEKSERQALAETIGGDGFTLLAAVGTNNTPAYLRALPEVQLLRIVWIQQYYAPADGEVQWRETKDLPPCERRIESPYDTDARYGSKRDTTWSGYKVHLTETCDDDMPSFIVDIQTTPATTQDKVMTRPIHQSLAERDLLPGEHFVDAGYTTADTLVESAGDGIDVVGPVSIESSWQRRLGAGYDIAMFIVDWDQQVVTCPEGKVSTKWKPTRTIYNLPAIHVEFHKRDCLGCPARQFCTRAKTGARELTMRPKAQHIALQTARKYQTTDEFKERYKKRAGVEGAVSQGVNGFGLRRTRYRGLAKTHLQHVFTAIAMNLVRFDAWIMEKPRAKTRKSHFAAMAPAA